MKTRNVIYYTLKSSQKFSDGCSINSGITVQFNFNEGEMYNVMYLDGNAERHFWVHISDLEKKRTKKEKWSDKKVLTNNLNLNEKWLEHEQGNITNAKRIAEATKSTSASRKTTRKKQDSKSNRGTSIKTKSKTTRAKKGAKKSGTKKVTRKK